MSSRGSARRTQREVLARSIHGRPTRLFVQEEMRPVNAVGLGNRVVPQLRERAAPVVERRVRIK